MPRWDPRHPSEKNPRWHLLNEGQKRYAEEQWKLARVRRGIIEPTDIDDTPLTDSGVGTTQPTVSAVLDNPQGHLPDIEDFDESLFDDIPHELQNPRPVTGMAEVEGQTVTGSGAVVRPATSSSGGSTAKKSRHNDQRAGNNLPGTAGGAGGGIGGGSEGGMIMEIPRPRNFKQTFTRSFNKQHKFLSFGIAPNIITKVNTPATAGNSYFLTTGLASLPVHQPSFYLTPMEFGLLYPGERVVGLDVTVVQRNVRVAFETSASTTGLATLNQNKNGICAVGLNLSGYGVDSNYTAYDATEAMKPTDVAVASYVNGVTLYGVDQGVAGFDATIPAHQFGIPIGLNTYWTSSTQSLTQGGWPNLEERIRSFDAADAVGQSICNYHYKPKVGLLKKDPWPRMAGNPYRGPLTNGTAVTVTIPNGRSGEVRNELLQPTCMGQPTQPTAAAQRMIISQIETEWNDWSGTGTALYAYEGWIEKSQDVSRGIDPHNEKHNIAVQPSLHVGVEAVPKLTTAALLNNTIPVSWTDVQTYFDVTATMHTEWHECAEFPHAKSNNESDISWSDKHLSFGIGTGANHNSSVILGRHSRDNRTQTIV